VKLTSGSVAELTDAELDGLVAYWEAANYLTVAQIYLQENALLREPLRAEHIKPRLLGHWGTSPGLNLVYAQLNRLIRETGQDVLYVAGPGHGGPALVANVYLEGTYSEIYPEVSADAAGLRRLVRQFSTPGGIPSHVSVPTPGSIHEGGELGYALVHAFGAAFDNPDLLVACVIGDGEAETAPLEGAWKGVRFLNPARDGAVLPILHLNENKISGPTVLGRAPEDEIRQLLAGQGYECHFVGGSEPRQVHADFAATLAECRATIAAIQDDARSGRAAGRPRWPAIVLRTPKGWTGPREVDGVKVEGTFRAHQVPLGGVRESAAHLEMLERWMRSYRPEERFDEGGRLVSELAALCPAGDKRMGATPHANGGRLLAPLEIPDTTAYALAIEAPGVARAESTRQLGELLRDLYRANPDNFRLFCPDETNSNRLGAVFEVSDRCLMDARPEDEHVSPEGRVMEVLSEHNCQGWLEGYSLSGRHGLFATYEAFAMVSASMAIQHTKWLEEMRRLEWRVPVASLNILLTSTCWRNDHNGFSHQGPGLIDTMLSLRGEVARIYFPPDANCLLAVVDHCLRSRDYVNLIVEDKQPQLQYLGYEEACAHAAAGASRWEWASSDGDGEADVVLGCAGDVPTQETLAAAWLLRRHTPELRVRVVNVIDLMVLFPGEIHPHGLPEEHFVELFGHEDEVVFAFHGYARALHQLLHGRPHPGRFHVRGFNEQGTTTTPFDMVVINRMSRYDLALEALRRAKREVPGASELREHCEEMLARHHDFVREHLEDMPEVRDWTWEPA
jgi:xylulose-5-phosphate/fructose-6-phosphate phosphoketolase